MLPYLGVFSKAAFISPVLFSGLVANKHSTKYLIMVNGILTCLIGKKQLLWTQCRGIGPHLAGRGKSHGFSRVAAGTWGIFSSYSGDVHSKL